MKEGSTQRNASGLEACIHFTAPVSTASYLCFGSDFENYADFGVAVGDNRAGNNVLQDQVGHSEELPGRGLWPVLKADVGLLCLIPLHLPHKITIK